ncbi:Glutamine-dependent NAD(+) synthetase [Posidoniimonas polymericola]|uniref:Glutamine-dependent NAD(+) synthetase n=1 Tax=Posidoniimonas polymericola TaxID=2528002 RepID=A0A5C5XXS6_9BACT|nr:NAD(+) synthase [Posidoniimonas polymericola]TWT67664.1 Glutamine-dependent NAD(+) synthetase [Posidoniimonas polymericola]
MKLIRLGAASVNQTPMDWDGNRRRIESAIADARAANVGLLCLPELCVSGYGCEDMFFSTGVQQAAYENMLALRPATSGMAVAVGLPVFYDSALYNACALLVDGELAGIVCKQFLATDGIHYESRWFRRWTPGVVNLLGDPIGDLLFDLGGVRVGFEICRDAWVADRSGPGLAQRGADIILNPSASHFAFGKQETRKRIVIEGSRAQCVSYVHCNLLGNESGRSVYDGDTIIASGGKIVASGPRLTFDDHVLTTAVVDVDAVRRSRAQSFDAGVTRPLPPDGLVEWSFSWPDPGADAPDEHCAPLTNWEAAPDHKEEEFTHAIALAVFDYLRKSRTNGLVVSLSGGADSSAVAVLSAMMARFAVDELGMSAVLDKLPAVATSAVLDDSATVRDLVGGLLSCVYQSTANSSDATRHSAQAVAEGVGATFFDWSVDSLVNDYVKTVGKAVGRELTWEDDDITLQNIQARARGPAVWMLANLQGALLLATSNRSEAAVGYATMDGDTCGGLSPIAGIDKAFLRRWLAWMEQVGPRGVGPQPYLSAVNELEPTAELRPAGADQTDEGDLMPYPVLDAIERSAMRDKRLPMEAFRAVAAQFPEHDRTQIGRWVIRFFQLWSRNQWKRERYAPSFHVDDENLDPKSWCRFPLLSSGYEKELDELEELLRD